MPWVSLQSPGACAFCSPSSNPRKYLEEFGAGLSLFRMRTCLLKLSWSSQTPHTTIPSTTQANSSPLPAGDASAPVAREPLWVYCSLSTLTSVRDDLPPNAVTALWVPMTVTSLCHTSNRPGSVLSTWNAPLIQPLQELHVPMSQMKRVRLQEMKWLVQVLSVSYNLNLN